MQRLNLSLLEKLPVEIGSNVFLSLSPIDLFKLSLVSKTISNMANEGVWFKLFKSEQPDGTKLKYDSKIDYSHDYFVRLFCDFYQRLNLKKENNHQAAFVNLFKFLLDSVDVTQSKGCIISPLIGALLFEKHITKHEAEYKVTAPSLYKPNNKKLFNDYIAMIDKELKNLLAAPGIKENISDLSECFASFIAVINALSPEQSKNALGSSERWGTLKNLIADLQMANANFDTSQTWKQNKEEYNAKFTPRS